MPINNSVRNSFLSDSTFNILLLPFGSSESCSNDVIICERELKKYFIHEAENSDLTGTDVVIDASIVEKNYIPTKEEIQSIGEKKNADIVIWGDYTKKCEWDSTKIQINYLIIDKVVSKYAGISRCNSSNSTVESISELSSGKLIGQTKDIVFWVLGTKDALFNRNFSKALSFLKKVNYDSNKLEFSGLFHLLAFCYQNVRDYESSIEFYTKVIRIDPGNFWAYNNRGAVYLNNMDIKKASEDLLKALELTDGKVPNILCNLSIIFMLVEDYEKALNLLDGAIKVNPYFIDAYINKAKIFALENNVDSALTNMRYAEKIEAAPSVLNLYALYYFSIKDYSKSLYYIERALVLNGYKDDLFNFDVNLRIQLLILKSLVCQKKGLLNEENNVKIELIKLGVSEGNNLQIPAFGGYLDFEKKER